MGNATEGTFQYNGKQNIQVGNTVAIYNGVAPNQRNLATSVDDDGEVVYVTIRAIDGSTYTYETADAKKFSLRQTSCRSAIQQIWMGI